MKKRCWQIGGWARKLAYGLCVAASVRAAAQQQTFRVYGTAEGLSNLNIRCLLQDRVGFLWVGTDNGLFRFDGSSFHQFGHREGLPSTEIHAMAASPVDGTLWVATPGGLAHIANNTFIPTPLKMDGDVTTVSALAFDSAGTLFLQHSMGIASVEPGTTVATNIATGQVHSLLVRQDGIYFGLGKDLMRLRDRHVEAVGAAHGLPPDAWQRMVQDSLGNFWVRSATRLFEFPHNGARFLDRSAGIGHTADAQLSADAHGRLYVTTAVGAAVLDRDKVSPIDSRHGLPDDGVGPMLLDRDDSLWVGLSGGGLARRLGHGEWTSWKRSDGLPHSSVWSITRDRSGQTWAGTASGLALLNRDGVVQRTWTSRTGLPADRVLSLEAVPGGDIFAGTDPEGLTQFSVSGQRLGTYGRRDGLTQRISGITVDRTRHLWLAGNGEVFRSTAPADPGARLHFQPMHVPGVTRETFLRDIIITPTDIVWVATSTGLLRYDGDHWRMYTEADGLKSADLDAIAEHDGQLWVAYRDAIGMTRFTVNGERLEGASVTMHDGLSSDDLYALAFDHAGRLWANSDKGVNVLENGRWRHMGSENGLVWDDTNSRALFIDDADAAWIGTSAGLSRYARLPFAFHTAPPPVALTAIHGKTQQWMPQDQPVIPYAERSLSVQYAALSFVTDRKRFRYRVLGDSDAWIETGGRTVQLAGLPAGNYTFEVVAQGENGDWSGSPARFVFAIRAPWWQGWPFLLSAALLLAAFTRLLWWLRMRSLIAVKERLQRKVDEQTTELREKNRRLEAIAYFDLLTSLPNRRMFANEFRKRLNAAERSGENFALLLIDLDLFKHINDTFGHDAGDAVLIETARRLQDAVRNCDHVARLGGDEFALILAGNREKFSGGREIEAVNIVCRRILHNCAAPITFKDQHLQVGCSIGVAMFPTDADSEDALYKAADIALYQTKRTTRNGFTWYSALQSQLPDQSEELVLP